jgi:hypothetical protein
MAHNEFSDMTLEEKKAHLGLLGRGHSQRDMGAPLMLNVKQAARTTTRRPTTTARPVTTSRRLTTTARPTTTRRLTTTARPTTTRRLTTTARPTTTRRLTTTARPTTTSRLTTTARPTTTRRLTTTAIVSSNSTFDWRNTPGMHYLIIERFLNSVSPKIECKIILFFFKKACFNQ